MNPKLDFIFARRSVRSYEKKDVPDSLVNDLLEAAMAAPSACGRDPWHFVVVRERDALRALAAGLPNGGMLADAAVGIAVCGSLAEAHDRQLSYLIQDCSAATENLLLAASTLGLGACWLGVHPREDRVVHVRTTLGVPAEITPIGVVSIGWPAGKVEARTRYARAKVHAGRW